MDRARFLGNLRRTLAQAPGRGDREALGWRRRTRELAGEEIFLLFRDSLERAGGRGYRADGPDQLRLTLEEITGGRSRMAAWGFDLPAGARDVLDGMDVAWIEKGSTEQGIPAAVLEAEVGVTGALLGVAETGSVVVASQPGENLLVVSLASVHVVLLTPEQLVVTLGDALAGLGERFPQGLPGNLAFVSGPSRSADIEQSLQVGAHGPREVHVVVTSA